MLRHDKTAPIWLFSFVDLAFLLLIAFTQIGPDVQADAIRIGQLEIPHIKSTAAPFDGNQAATGWQLRVYPSAGGEARSDDRSPFELIEPGTAGVIDAKRAGDEPFTAVEQIDASELAAHLRLLHERQIDRPILAPHRDSRSEDLLIAVGLLEEVWRANRAVAVVPDRAVSSGSSESDEATR